MGGSYSLVSTNDDNDVYANSLIHNQIVTRPECALQIREPLHQGTVNTLATVKKDILISAGSDKQIIVQDLDAGGFITKFLGHEKEITKLVYKHVNDNDFVLSGSLDETIRLWQFGIASPVGVYRAPGMKVSGLAAINDNVIISGSTDETLRLWDVNTKTIIKSVHIPENGITHIAKSPVHEIIAQTSTDKTLKIFDTRSLELVFTSKLKHFPLLHCDIRDSVYCLTSSSGTANEGCDVTLWDLRQQRPVNNLCGHDGPVRAAIFLPQQVTWKRLALSCSEDHTVHLYDIDLGASIWNETMPGFGHLTCCTGFVDGSVAISGTEGYICITKLLSKSGKIFLCSNSLQGSIYQSMQSAQDLEAIGLT